MSDEPPYVLRTHLIGSALGSTPEGLYFEDKMRREEERRRRENPYQALCDDLNAEVDRLILFGSKVVL